MQVRLRSQRRGALHKGKKRDPAKEGLGASREDVLRPNSVSGDRSRRIAPRRISSLVLTRSRREKNDPGVHPGSFPLVAGRNWQGATIGLRAPQDPLMKHHFCTPSYTPWGCKPCTPLANNASLRPELWMMRSLVLPVAPVELDGIDCSASKGVILGNRRIPWAGNRSSRPSGRISPTPEALWFLSTFLRPTLNAWIQEGENKWPRCNSPTHPLPLPFSGWPSATVCRCSATTVVARLSEPPGPRVTCGSASLIGPAAADPPVAIPS
jgi:hypothetical protein